MKNILVLILSLLILSPIFAQDPCGTHTPEDFIKHLRTKDKSYLKVQRRTATQYVPIQYHIVGTDDGLGYHSLRDLLTVHCELNDKFAATDIYFYLHDNVNYINESDYFTFTSTWVGNSMMSEYNVSNVCNVYVVSDPRGVCGYAYYPGSGPAGGGIVLNSGCHEPGSTTLTHEMGHYLGLPHTFSGWEGRDPYVDAATSTDERVNGSNCSNRGDGFCDTPADFISDRWSCPYSGSKTDYNGDLYTTVLDESFFMSYSSDVCQNKFSNEQQAEMNWVLPNQRGYLLTHPNPSFVAPDTTYLSYPAVGANNIASNFTRIEWTAAAGATHYHIMIATHPSLAAGIHTDIIVNDTFMALTDLAINQQYYWIVQPITLGNVCGSYSQMGNFRTSNILSAATVENIECNGDNNGYIEITPSGGTPPYFYSWNDGSTLNPRATLSAGTHSVTVSDITGSDLEMSFTINEPNPLQVTITPIGGGNLQANATGGTPPYTFVWNDGTVDDVQTNPGVGNVSVTVMDNNDCSANKTEVYSDIPVVESQLEVIVYPNPVSQQDFIVTEIKGLQSEAQLTVTSIDGRHIYNKALTGNTSTQYIPTEGLSSGIYFIKVSAESINKTVRFTVL